MPPLPERSTSPLALCFVVGLLFVAGLSTSVGVGVAATAPDGEAAGPTANRTATLTDSPATDSSPTDSPPTDSPTPTGSPVPSESPTSDPSTPPDATDDAELVVTAVDTVARVRPTASFTVDATVTNEGNVTATESVEYVFDGSTSRSREVTVEPGTNRTVRFEASVASLDGVADDSTGTYVHGVRTADGDGVARYLRVTPDVDLSVTGFDAPAQVTMDRTFVVLATVSNPANTTITRRVTYRFDGTVAAAKTLTVGGDATEQVAFAVSAADVQSAGVSLQTGTTYDHAVVAAGGARDTDAVRLVDGSSAGPDALVVERFDGPHDIRPDETYTVNTTVRNVDTLAFEGRLTYRLDGSVVTTAGVRVPAGEQRVVRFRVDYDDIDRSRLSSSASVDQGVWVGNTTLTTSPATVHGAPETPTSTPTPTPTLDRDSTATTTASSSETASTDTVRSADEACRRGFFTRCGGTALDQTTLTIIGTVTSVLGIVYELFSGD